MQTMAKMIDAMRRLAGVLSHRFSWLPPIVARVTLGVVFVESGWGKLHNLGDVTGFFAQLGIPAPHLMAPFVAGTELVAGALVLVGLMTRLATVPLMVTMVVAIVTAKAGDLSSISDLFGFSEFLYLGLLLYLGVSGAGALALDPIAGRGLDKACRVILSPRTAVAPTSQAAPSRAHA